MKNPLGDVDASDMIDIVWEQTLKFWRNQNKDKNARPHIFFWLRGRSFKLAESFMMYSLLKE